MDRNLRIENMGVVSYGPMLALQEQRHLDIQQGKSDDTLFLLEHWPVVTSGRNGKTESLLASESELKRRGVQFYCTGRGGDVTYHAPGQVVGYPIVELQESERDIKSYVWKLEEILIRTSQDYGLKAERIEGLRGIWVGERKLAAIGVRLSRWVTMHGFALNVSVDLSGFGLIVPCGLYGKGVTSLGLELGEAPPLGHVQSKLGAHAADVLGRQSYQALPTGLPAPIVTEDSVRIPAVR